MASYESAIPYIQKAERGLSNALTDTASQKPSPYIYSGQNWKGAKYLKPGLPVHTNRGITWETFTGLSKQAGYDINEKNFINMPDTIWLSIYKMGYWIPMKGDKYNSQAIANAVVDFAWASGIGGSTWDLKKYLATKGIIASNADTIADGFNKLIKEKGEANTFNDLINERKRFFKSLNQPANEKGWLSRMDELQKQGSAILGVIKSNMGKTSLVVLGIGALATAIYFYSKNK